MCIPIHKKRQRHATHGEKGCLGVTTRTIPFFLPNEQMFRHARAESPKTPSLGKSLQTTKGGGKFFFGGKFWTSNATIEQQVKRR